MSGTSHNGIVIDDPVLAYINPPDVGSPDGSGKINENFRRLRSYILEADQDLQDQIDGITPGDGEQWHRYDYDYSDFSAASNTNSIQIIQNTSGDQLYLATHYVMKHTTRFNPSAGAYYVTLEWGSHNNGGGALTAFDVNTAVSAANWYHSGLWTGEGLPSQTSGDDFVIWANAPSVNLDTVTAGHLVIWIRYVVLSFT